MPQVYTIHVPPCAITTIFTWLGKTLNGCPPLNRATDGGIDLFLDSKQREKILQSSIEPPSGVSLSPLGTLGDKE